MALSKQTIQYVADLSRIELAPEELERLSGQLQTILDFIDQLKKAEIADIPATSHILPLVNVVREDAPSGSLPVEKVLANAPRRKNDFFIVPKVIE